MEDAAVRAAGDLYLGKGMGTGAIPAVAYLVKAHGVLFLVDAGLVQDPHRPPLERPARALLDFSSHPGATVAAQLDQAGVPRDAISFILLTHAHYDHAGELESFPGIPVVAAPEEWAWLGGMAPVALELKSGRRATSWEALRPRLRSIPWSDEPVGPFTRTFDLLGNGDVVLLHAPGHTPGSLAVLLRTSAEGSTLLAGDAAASAPSVRGQVPKGPLGKAVDDDTERASGSLAALHDLDRRLPGLTILASHDPAGLAARNHFNACARGLLAR
jgi:glyoxylase-like metal-dependent hydrolase (beta-lactamase superfamily II)